MDSESSSRRAAATAARIPLVMPSPWSPSAATASNLPSSASLASMSCRAAVSARSTMPWPGAVPASGESTVDSSGTGASAAPVLR